VAEEKLTHTIIPTGKTVGEPNFLMADPVENYTV